MFFHEAPLLPQPFFFVLGVDTDVVTTDDEDWAVVDAVDANRGEVEMARSPMVTDIASGSVLVPWMGVNDDPTTTSVGGGSGGDVLFSIASTILFTSLLNRSNWLVCHVSIFA